MRNPIRALILILFVASCGSKETAAPRELDNACSILDQRPKYLRAMKKAEKKWGVPVSVQMATMYQESKFIGDARTPFRFVLGVIPMGRQSSALGYSQALDGTWEEYQEQTGNRGGKRTDIRDATDFMGWYMAGSHRELNIPLSDARNQYLAYHDGRGGYRRGTWRSKAWLIEVADAVADRAVLYDTQLRYCGKL